MLVYPLITRGHQIMWSAYYKSHWPLWGKWHTCASYGWLLQVLTDTSIKTTRITTSPWWEVRCCVVQRDNKYTIPVNGWLSFNSVISSLMARSAFSRVMYACVLTDSNTSQIGRVAVTSKEGSLLSLQCCISAPRSNKRTVPTHSSVLTNPSPVEHNTDRQVNGITLSLNSQWSRIYLSVLTSLTHTTLALHRNILPFWDQDDPPTENVPFARKPKISPPGIWASQSAFHRRAIQLWEAGKGEVQVQASQL